MHHAWFVLFASGCSLTTSWDGLPIGVGPDAASDANEAGCESGALYCGGDGVVGKPSTLYQCGASGTATAVVSCSKGCVRRQPASDDACVCTVGGFYCGNDQVVGDPKTLYKCAADYGATFVQSCPNQCVVNVGVDDTCK
jgi:hypothetical protein